jgi:glycosyltransferase involved in cell wall biosynthesis
VTHCSEFSVLENPPVEVSIPARKITLIQNAVSRRSGSSTADADIVALARSRRTLLAVGQIAPFKGTHLLVEAAMRLMEKDDDLQVLIVGEMPAWPADLAAYARGLEDRVAAAGLSGRIRFVGARQNVLDIMRASYLFVAPILQEETFGNVVLEAKTAGLPSVVFPNGGLVELVKHQETGFLCRDDSLDALLEGLAFYLPIPRR